MVMVMGGAENKMAGYPNSRAAVLDTFPLSVSSFFFFASFHRGFVGIIFCFDYSSFNH